MKQLPRPRNAIKAATPQFTATLVENVALSSLLKERDAFSSDLAKITPIPGPPGPQGPQGLPNVIQDEGTPLTARAALNFAGAGVTATDDAANSRTRVTIPGGSQTPWTSDIDAAGWGLANASSVHSTGTFNLDNATLSRWVIGRYDAETGSNAGSNLNVHSYGDGGAYLATPVIIDRASGYVGLNQVNPAARCHLKGAGQTAAAFDTVTGSQAATVYVQDSGFAIGNGGAVLFGWGGGSFAAIKGYVQDGSGYSSGDLIFSTRRATSDTYLTESMRVFATGDIGFGPTARMAVISVPSDGAADSGAFVISTRNLGTLGERMRITAAGWICMNLMNGPGGPPSSPLHVFGLSAAPSASADAQVFTVATSITTQMCFGGDPNGPYGCWIQVKSEYSSGATYPLLLNPVGGNVGVGVSDPGSYKLNVAGSVLFSGDCNITGAYRANGIVGIGVLPSTAPAAGSKGLWYDPADGNRVKYVP